MPSPRPTLAWTLRGCLTAAVAVLAGAQIAAARHYEKVFDPVDEGESWTAAIHDVQVDAAENLYVLIGVPPRVFKRTPAGVVTTILDSTGDGGGNTLDCGAGLCSMLVATDGTVFVAGEVSDTVFRVAPTGAITVLEAGVASGADCSDVACWKPRGTRGFKYVDAERAADGVRTVLLQSGDDGKAKIVLKAGKENLLDLPLPLALPFVVQLQGDNGGCWESEFSPAGVRRSTDTSFLGLAD